MGVKNIGWIEKISMFQSESNLGLLWGLDPNNLQVVDGYVSIRIKSRLIMGD